MNNLPRELISKIASYTKSDTFNPRADTGPLAPSNINAYTTLRDAANYNFGGLVQSRLKSTSILRSNESGPITPAQDIVQQWVNLDNLIAKLDQEHVLLSAIFGETHPSTKAHKLRMDRLVDSATDDIGNRESMHSKV
jgi:hypothetical protein